MQNEKLIRIQIVPIEMGFVRASSSDLPGFYAAARSQAALALELPAAVAEFLEMDGNKYAMEALEQQSANTYTIRAVAAATDAHRLRRAC